jgi:cell wall-associated NlpC family hydrolase
LGRIFDPTPAILRKIMVKFFSAISLIVLLGSCSSLKTLGFNANRQVSANSAATTPPKPKQAKFIEEISVSAEPVPAVKDQSVENKLASKITAPETPLVQNDLSAYRSSVVEKATPLQLKYSVLLNTEVELLANNYLLQGVDEWYGTRYRMGGTTKRGVDCSAFTSAVYTSVYGLTIPRTAREQYRTTRRISMTELKEGDLLFFNTTGGVSHVGIYLQNNKFIHATSSRGVMVSDLFQNYYLKRYVGAGRIDNKQALAPAAVATTTATGGF